MKKKTARQEMWLAARAGMKPGYTPGVHNGEDVVSKWEAPSTEKVRERAAQRKVTISSRNARGDDHMMPAALTSHELDDIDPNGFLSEDEDAMSEGFEEQVAEEGVLPADMLQDGDQDEGEECEESEEEQPEEGRDWPVDPDTLAELPHRRRPGPASAPGGTAVAALGALRVPSRCASDCVVPKRPLPATFVQSPAPASAGHSPAPSGGAPPAKRAKSHRGSECWIAHPAGSLKLATGSPHLPAKQPLVVQESLEECMAKLKQFPAQVMDPPDWVSAKRLYDLACDRLEEEYKVAQKFLHKIIVSF